MTKDAEKNAKISLQSVLEDALLLFSVCEHSRGAEARDVAGHPIHPSSLQATSFSLTGALYRACRYDGSPEKMQLLKAATKLCAEKVPGGNFVKFNDAPERTRSDIVQVLMQVALS